jgi:hypothetical protein
VWWSLQNLRRLGFCPTQIIDCGAYDGTWTRRCREIFPEARVLCIEPQQAKESLLQQVRNDVPGMNYVMALVGKERNENVKRAAALTIIADYALTILLPALTMSCCWSMLPQGQGRQWKACSIRTRPASPRWLRCWGPRLEASPTLSGYRQQPCQQRRPVQSASTGEHRSSRVARHACQSMKIEDCTWIDLASDNTRAAILRGEPIEVTALERLATARAAILPARRAHHSRHR